MTKIVRRGERTPAPILTLVPPSEQKLILSKYSANTRQKLAPFRVSLSRLPFAYPFRVSGSLSRVPFASQAPFRVSLPHIPFASPAGPKQVPLGRSDKPSLAALACRAARGPGGSLRYTRARGTLLGRGAQKAPDEARAPYEETGTYGSCSQVAQGPPRPSKSHKHELYKHEQVPRTRSTSPTMTPHSLTGPHNDAQ